MGLQTAIVMARGGPPSDAERSLLEFLKRELTTSAWMCSSVELFAPSGAHFEIDLVILGHYGLYVVEVKDCRGWSRDRLQDWLGTPVAGFAQSAVHPFALTQEKARLLAELLKQDLGAGRVQVEPVVVLTGSDVEFALPSADRSRVLTPGELVRAVQFGDLPGVPIAATREPLDEVMAATLRRLLSQEVRPRPRPGQGRLRDELPLLVRDVALDLESRAENPELLAATWVVACAFVRAIEERGLLDENLLAGDGSAEAERAFFAHDPLRTVNDLLFHILDSVAAHPAGEAVLEEPRNLLLRAPLSNAAARALIDFFRQPARSGRLRWSFAGDPWTDLYQEVSQAERQEHAMLATPSIVSELLLDLTLAPALDELGFDATRLIDPACGSGLLLRAAFERLHERALNTLSSADPAACAVLALDRIHGADLSSIAVLVTRIQLLLAYLERAQIRRLAEARRPPLHVVAADSLLVGRRNGLSDVQEEPVLSRKYEVVICELPFVACKDAARRELYRKLYPRSTVAHGSMIGPFIERGFELATEGGFVGFFTSNSFMKRQLGKRLVEEFLSGVELTRIVDTSGAYLPGHGTPTVLLFARNRPPTERPVRVLVGRRGEPIVPLDPARGEVWSAIVAHHDDVGYEDEYIAVADVARDRFATHPWALAVGARAEVKEAIEHGSPRLRDLVGAIRTGVSSGLDRVFLLPWHAPLRLGLEREVIRPDLSGESIRDWITGSEHAALVPYEQHGNRPLPQDRDARWWRFLWRYRTLLENRSSTAASPAPWWAWLRWRSAPPPGAPRLLSPGIARMNDFTLSRGEGVPRSTVSCVEMSEDASEEDCFALLGYLNSSVACYWLKQTSLQMGNERVPRASEGIFEFASSMGDVPVPRPVLEPGPLRADLVSLARRLDRAAQERAACAPDRVLATWARVSRDALIEALGAAQMGELASLRQMVCDQEDLDWVVYEAVGLSDSSLRRAPGSALPEQRPFAWLSDEPPPGLDRRLVEPWKRRREAARSSRLLRVVEDPSCKRRFRRSPRPFGVVIEEDTEQEEAPPPERLRGPDGEGTHGREFRQRIASACEAWLLERLEDVFRNLDGARALEEDDIASRIATSPGVADVMSLLRTSRGDVGWVATPRTILEAHAVSYLAAFRHTEAGLDKRSAWERTWQMQRREDNGEDVHPAVPPGYDPRDYRDAVTWLHRGKLDVPTERFIRYPAASSGGAFAMYGWAGWDAEQRAAVLRALFVERRTRDGWKSARLVPLLAGILELEEERPRSADRDLFVDRELDLRDLGLSLDTIRAFRPAEQMRKRKGHQP
jgi:hypothetical protein